MVKYDSGSWQKSSRCKPPLAPSQYNSVPLPWIPKKNPNHEHQVRVQEYTDDYDYEGLCSGSHIIKCVVCPSKISRPIGAFRITSCSCTIYRVLVHISYVVTLKYHRLDIHLLLHIRQNNVLLVDNSLDQCGILKDYFHTFGLRTFLCEQGSRSCAFHGNHSYPDRSCQNLWQDTTVHRFCIHEWIV